jgi:hypothetical protein
MPIASAAAYQLQLRQATRVAIFKDRQGPAGTANGFWTSAWRLDPNPGAAPTTPAAPTNQTLGAAFFGGGAWFLGVDLLWGIEGAQTIVLCDRLSHQGGLSGTSVAVQTTNLPTAALTRSVSGDGVFAVLEIYTAVGGTPATATVSYTNQAGVAGRTGTAQIGDTGFSGSHAMCFVTLQAGDTGVRSVESVQLSGSTGTAGDFGVTLFRPIAILPLMWTQGPGPASSGQRAKKKLILSAYELGQLPSVPEGACLFHFIKTDNSATAAQSSVLLFGAL